MLRRISTIITCLPLSFISDTLNEIFVEIADIQVPYLMERKLKSELQFLGNSKRYLSNYGAFLQGTGETEGRAGWRP
jgi:hypothetical protein